MAAPRITPESPPRHKPVTNGGNLQSAGSARNLTGQIARRAPPAVSLWYAQGRWPDARRQYPQLLCEAQSAERRRSADRSPFTAVSSLWSIAAGANSPGKLGEHPRTRGLQGSHVWGQGAIW